MPMSESYQLLGQEVNNSYLRATLVSVVVTVKQVAQGQDLHLGGALVQAEFGCCIPLL